MAKYDKLIAKYPEYADMPPESALEQIHKKEFSNIPTNEFFESVGFKPSISGGVKADIGFPVFKGMSGKQLADLRSKYPEFKDQPNEQFVNSVYQKHFSKISRPEFNEMIGYTTEPAEVARGLAAGAVSPIYGLLGKQDPQWGAGPYYEAAKPIGELAPLVGGGLELEAVRGAWEGLEEAPAAIRGLAKYLGTGAGRAIGSTGAMAGYGALTSPEDRLQGAKTGAEFGVAAEAAPALAGIGLKNLGSLLGKFSDTTQATKLLDNLGGLEKVPLEAKDQFNANKAGEMLRGGYLSNLTDTQNIYKPVFDKVGDAEIYEPSEGLFGRKINKPYIDAKYDLTGDLKETHDKFVSNPTFQNAHILQSDLGKEYSSAKSAFQKDKTDANKKEMKMLRSARNTLKTDMDKFLTKTDESGALKQQYDRATKSFRENVVPYLTDKRIGDIVTGKVTYPKSLSNIFAFPGGKKEGTEHLDKIMEDLGDPLKDRIIYDELNKAEKKPSGQAVIDLYKNLGFKGLRDYITPSLRDQMGSLTKTTEQSGMFKRGAGALAGLGLLHPLGMSSSVIGGLLGLRYEPSVERGLRTLLGKGVAPESMLKGAEKKEAIPLQNLYRLIAASLTANSTQEK